MTRTTISQTDLETKAHEVVDRVQHGEIAVVESSGHERAILLDPLDFRLLMALAQCAIEKAELFHYTGDLGAWGRDGVAIGQLTSSQMQQFAYQWLNRDRARAVFVEPNSGELRTLDTTGTAPVFSTRSLTSGLFIALTISSLKRFTTSGGVPAGATMPHVCEIS